MWALKAFLLGGFAVGVLTYAVVALLALTVQAGGRTLDVALGPLLLVAVEEAGGVTVTTFGPALVLVGIAGGVANLAAAHVLRQRSGGRADHRDG